MIWEIRHGAIPTGRFLYGCKYLDSPNCNYCGELEDLPHSFVTCSRLSGLFQLTQSLIRKLTPPIYKIPVWWYIIGIPASAGHDVNVRRLCNWIFAQCKIAIVYSRFNKYRSSGTQCAVTLFKAKVIWRVNVEYQFARFKNTVCNFVEKWNTRTMYCVKWKMTILFLTYRFKIYIFDILGLLFILHWYIIYDIRFLNIFPTKHYIFIKCISYWLRIAMVLVSWVSLLWNTNNYVIWWYIVSLYWLYLQ